MQLAEVPLALMLLGLAAYTVLGGADFGAGFWRLVAGGGPRGAALREHAYHAMGPVWEANHVWLIFVLVVCWTCYPTAFGSITSTLTVPLFIAAIGIVLRGTAYALRATTGVGERVLGTIFALSSILTPFALGTAVGGIASGRVPVGNAAGDLVTSWLNPTSVVIGVLAVVSAAYLAAVFLAGDAVRAGRAELAGVFRNRALAAGVVAGAVALAGLVVVRQDTDDLWDGLTSGLGLLAVAASAVAGIATVALVWRRRFEPARFSAAVAVGAIVAGWGLAQSPRFLPGLSVDEAAAERPTLVAVVVVIACGLAVLVPSLALLFGLVLRGRFDVGRERPEETTRAAVRFHVRPLLLVAAVAVLVGLPVALFADATWAIALGVVCLLGAVASAFAAVAPDAAAPE
ncbi:MAG: cytochrome d ubiquinol oxidase subunit II [Actinomycetota bacterium]|nr:cytochrome d ubiquinol oxidase subunit II [Actinomycetota bacterium]